MNMLDAVSATPTTRPASPPIRIVTAASLFDGHDAAINMMRRLLQAPGVEVIHLGHNRSAAEIVECAIQEDARAIAITSYQGGHLEFFKYIVDLLRARGAETKIFGGGGGTILQAEIEELHRYGVTRLYSPEDGRALGLQGMIDDLLARCGKPVARAPASMLERVERRDTQALAALISEGEDHPEKVRVELRERAARRPVPVLGVTGTGGAGKSSLVDELLLRFLRASESSTVAVLCVDPSKRKSGGALLGDRIRMNSLDGDRVYFRSLATRGAHELPDYLGDVVTVLKAAGFDLVVVETPGIGQGDAAVVPHVNTSMYVMTPEFGAASQLEKIDMLDFADVVFLL